MSVDARFLQGLLAGLAGVAIVVFTFSRLFPVNATAAGLLFLVVVLAAATARGLAVAAVVSVVATVCLNYFFLPPVGEFTIADPENWVALFTFLVTALVASHLSNGVRQQAEQARNSQRETERLYALSRAILLTAASSPIGTQAAQSIAQIFESPGVLVFDAKSGEIHRGGPGEVFDRDVEELLRDVARQGNRHRRTNLDIWPIALGGKPIGALALAGPPISDAALQSMLNLVAIALERVRSEEAANRAEAARQSEEFKSTLLDAIAHEFKTPLTSIKAAASGLRLAEGALPPDLRELTSIIDEETDRLSQLVTEAVKMAEIDAGKTAPRRDFAGVLAMLGRAKDSFAGRGDERVLVEPSAGALPRLWVDADLIVLALRQLIDNALKYAGPASPVTCRADAGPGRVTLRVEDRGPGVPEAERERIFEKFYRRAHPREQPPGTGMGLHIAREIARVHGGDLWVESGNPSGTAFCLTLPLRAET